MLGQDGELALYRGVAGDGAPALVLAPLQEHAAPAILARLEHEYDLRAELDPAWAVRPRALVREAGKLRLVLDDPGGELLESQLGQSLAPSAALPLAISLACALGQAHDRGLIHKDLCPAHVLVNGDQVRLTGFGLASRLPKERHAMAPPEIIAGTLPYLAPEQTGRMNRSIDARSDLYALGVILYRMLTGELPFAAADPLEWIHCHVARQPVPPAERVPGVPAVLSAIVMKCLAKTAEDRYQTAAGVAADLIRCLARWDGAGVIEPFVLGAHDIPDRLHVPEKLYGREAEVATLLAAFDRVVGQGRPELVLVSGYSGVGKSSVVNELHKALVPSRGWFAAGKFNQYQRDIPYSTLAQAFQGLIRSLLAKSEAELARWRDELCAALAPNGLLMVNLVPELKLIIGEQPPVPDLPPPDAEYRFRRVVRRFIGVFARAEHPLALFLDDLQWLDAATLALLADLATHPELSHLLLVGAYRDNEVDRSHPLMRSLDAIRQAGGALHEIVLAPLAPADVGRLVADALRCTPEAAKPLARLVSDKTGGNPFFTIQFLSALAEEELLAFDSARGAWVWNLKRIRAKGYTDNVVDLMVGKLARLPQDTRDALETFACLGNAADAATLGRVLEQAPELVHASLWAAVRAGLVIRQEQTYAFLHDRVQEATYSLIPGEKRAGTHLAIGRLLAAGLAPEEIAERIFDVVDQLNRGCGLVESPEERERIAELNLTAGRRAQASTAYVAALSYLSTGAGLLAEDCWVRRHDLAFALEFHRAECEFLTSELAMAEERLATLSKRAANTVEQAAVACLRMDLYTTLDQSGRAVAVCLAYLRDLGIQWSPHPTEADARREYERIGSLLGSRTIEDLIDLPRMEDPASFATIDVLTKVLPPALFTDVNLASLTICRAVGLSLERGNCDASCFAYVMLGRIAGPRFGDYPAGFRFGRVGYELVDKRGLKRFEASTTLCFSNFVVQWTKHVRACRALVGRAFDAANRIGDLTYGAYACNVLNTDLLFAGDPLSEVQREAEHGLAFAEKARFGLVIDIITSQLALIRMLRGSTPEFGCLGEGTSDELRIEKHLSSSPLLAIAACWHWIRKLQARYLAGDHAAALDAAARAQPLLWTSAGFLEEAEYHFYGALARAACCDSSSGGERQQHLKALAAHHRQLGVWAENGPENFADRHALVGAEIARLEGRDLEAMHLYERAIRSARDNGFIHNEALAKELAARFYLERGFDRIAHIYLRDAHYGYLRWGALGKVRQLEAAWPQLAERERPAPAATIGAPMEQLDMATVVKASQAVSSDIVLDRLTETLMRITLEHAGADRGLLLLPQADSYRIAARGSMDQGALQVSLGGDPPAATDLPEALVHYVARAFETVLLDDSAAPNPFAEDPYLIGKASSSILCLPLVKQAKLVGILYLENNLTPRAFTRKHLAVLELLASQAAISLENAILYAGLQEREARIRRLMEANIIGIFFWNLAGDVVAANDALLDVVGYSRQDLDAGKVNWAEITPPEWQAADERATAEIRATGRCRPYEKEYVRKDGSRVPVLVGGSLFEGSTEEGVAFVLDLTERKRAEADRQARQAAELASQAKSAFLASMSHELRTPLNAILGYAQLLERDQRLDARQRLGVSTIRHSGEFLLTLIDDILDLSKIEAGKVELHPEATDLSIFLRDVVDIVRPRATLKNLAFSLALAPDLPRSVRIDSKRICQVLLNLLSNALKFTDRGEVGLEVQRLPDGDRDARLRFAVRDSGVGIEAAQLEVIFQPFEQVGEVRRRAGGTGLGLAISRQLVRLMGGEMQVESTPGQGSRFWFEISVAIAEPSAATPRARRAAIAYLGPPKRVLVVDDVPANRAMLSDFPSSVGFLVDEAADGQQALEQAQALRPDLIVLDVMLPVLDGLAVTRRLREMPELAQVPIIAVSASTAEDNVTRSLAAGADAFIAKPVELDCLLEQVGLRLGLSWTYAQPPRAMLGADGPLVVPPREEMEVLYRLACLGDMKEISRHADRVAALDRRYSPFAQRLRELADGYQSQAILRLVEQNIGDSE